jgi:ketosteroid isomerase-like protein
MSRENVGVVRLMYDAYARGDLETSRSCLDPQVVWSQPAQEPGAGTYRGHEGVDQALSHWVGAWDDYNVEVDEFIDFGDHVLANTRHRGRGKSSGVNVERRIFQLLTVRDGKITRMRVYYDEAEALDAAGSAFP